MGPLPSQRVDEERHHAQLRLVELSQLSLDSSARLCGRRAVEIEQATQWQIERVRDLRNHRERRVLFSALDASEVGRIQVGGLGQRFDRQSALLPNASDCGSELLRVGFDGHGRNVARSLVVQTELIDPAVSS